MNLPTIGWKKLLKLLGPLLFLFFFIRVVDPYKTANLLKNINPMSALLSMAFFPVLVYFRTLRWWMISRQIKLEIPLKQLFQINYIAWFLGNLPVGEFRLSLNFFTLKTRASQPAEPLFL